MLRHNNPQLDIEGLADRIRRRSEAAAEPPAWCGERRWRESLEGRAVELGASRQRGRRTVENYGLLLALPDDDFIDAAYCYLLGRLPTPAERSRDQERLMAGSERERMLLSLADQAPPAGHDTESLPGLARGLARARLKYTPKLGRLVRWALSALRLDQLRQRLHHSIHLQDARYQALLEQLRRQAQQLEALKADQLRLQIDNEELRDTLAQRPAAAAALTPAVLPPAALGHAAIGDEGRDADGRDFYRALEARFRGAPGAIAELMREHLPEVRSVAPLADGLPLLDLGCGRGEWLALLREEGIEARGVDLNAANVRAGREQGLAVRYQDALEALRESDDDSLGMVSAFHLVEHLTHAQLCDLLGEAFRALAPGGRLLLETPNPQNLIVGSCNFYLDPTHVRPLPPDFLAFLADYTGFKGVEARPLHPVGEEYHLREDSETTRRLNHYLYGPQDYALLATKPGRQNTAGVSPDPSARQEHRV